ncbi:hypothetical protein [Amycolatopsis regifaucium]|nr:hypothetical protein [Amycolatopsis regifaucium]
MTILPDRGRLMVTKASRALVASAPMTTFRLISPTLPPGTWSVVLPIASMLCQQNDVGGERDPTGYLRIRVADNIDQCGDGNPAGDHRDDRDVG